MLNYNTVLNYYGKNPYAKVSHGLVTTDPHLREKKYIPPGAHKFVQIENKSSNHEGLYFFDEQDQLVNCC